MSSNTLRVYLRTHALDQMVQAANSTAGLRTIKRVHLKPKVPTKSVCSEHLELRKEILTLLNLQKQLRVYLRTHALDQMVQAANSTAGLRTIKRVDQTLQDLGVHLKPKVPTKSVCSEHLELRKEILTLLNLQKQLQNREAEATANRDNTYAEAPSTPKRAYRGDAERTIAPDSLGFGGDRVSKRDHKRKVPGRFMDAPPSPPQSKRPRKLKSSDG
ncbi:SWR1-complex protein 4-like [Curcuma longa]|uniref:SWR1-complex protein 4-like n=1 Tax=Curcuma longa TaxID=136217 RepID=UPI003D9E2FA1